MQPNLIIPYRRKCPGCRPAAESVISHGCERQPWDAPTEQPSFAGSGPPYGWLRTTLGKDLKIRAETLGLNCVERKTFSIAPGALHDVLLVTPSESVAIIWVIV